MQAANGRRIFSIWSNGAGDDRALSNFSYPVIREKSGNCLGILWGGPVRAKSFLSLQHRMGLDIRPFLRESP